MAGINTEQKLTLLETMFLSRESDRREGILSRQGKGWFQISSMGHEALVAASLNLGPEDYIFPHYRDKALMLGRGAKIQRLAMCYLGKRGSSSGGRQLPGHFSDHSLHIWSMASPTGSNLLPAAGLAWGLQLDGKHAVVLACVGDAGMRQGEFYEALAFAMEKNLPVVFLVEDNGFGISTSTLKSNPLRKNLFDPGRIIQFDARKVDDVYDATARAVDRARKGLGPVILWGDLDRMSSHSSSDDHRIYRPVEEIEAMLTRDPIEQLIGQLIAAGHLTFETWEEKKKSLVRCVEEAYQEAELRPDPQPSDTYEQLLGEQEFKEELLFKTDGKSWRMLDAVNECFRQGLRRDRRYVFFGEDIQDPMGGVFKLTNGLSTEFPDRVFNSPLAEATIMGVACGLASYGMRPVFELQFIDFVGPAWNQLVNNLATLRWRTFGDWTVPAVIYAPYGAYLPAGGPWHSQSNESAFAHIPGVRVVVPYTAEDAGGLMHTAMNSQDPTIFLLPKHLLRMKREVPSHVVSVPFGKARILREGFDVTVVSWGNCLEKVESAADELEGIASVEIVDLRSIQPWDRETVIESVLKTGRLLVVQEDNRSCSVGQMIISDILSVHDIWDSMRKAPVLLSREDIHIGFNPVYEETCLPSTDQVMDAILSITEGGEVRAQREEDSSGGYTAANGTPGLAVIRIPAIGEGLEEARILKFFKNPGDVIKRDELIYQLETDKAVVDIESPQEGVLESWNTPEDAIVKIGAVIGHLKTGDGGNGIQTQHELHASKKIRKMETTPTERATPNNISRMKNPQNERQPQPQSTETYDEITLSAQQQLLATRMARAARVAVPATIFQEASWDAIHEARQHLKNTPGTEGITTFTLVAWCVTRAVAKHSVFRSSLPLNTILRVYKKVHLGCAVSLPSGDLTTAVLENASDFKLKDFYRRLKEQIDLARQGQDQARQPASLIITSMATFNIPDGIPVIVPPSVATLLINSAQEKVVLEGGKPVAKSFVKLALTIDHRVINGCDAGGFLNEIRDQIENFKPLPEILG